MKQTSYSLVININMFNILLNNLTKKIKSYFFVLEKIVDKLINNWKISWLNLKYLVKLVVESANESKMKIYVYIIFIWILIFILFILNSYHFIILIYFKLFTILKIKIFF